MELPADFLARMRPVLGNGFQSFLDSYSRPAEKGLRVNTLKIQPDEFMRLSPFPLERVPWEENGFYALGDGLGKTVYHAAGLYYVQEPSAMCAAPKLGVSGVDRVLDLCSAPGGKGTQLAQYMQGEGLLVLNEVNFSRAKILSSNVERLGVKNAVVTCASTSKLASEFDSYFDKILVDAPCSGEGMFKKEAAAIPEWSVANVKACAERQSHILDDAYAMLAAGGKIVYSTCTFAPEEDELQIEKFLNNRPLKLLEMKKLYPHEVRGEGHFYAVMQKTDGERKDARLLQPYVKDRKALEGFSAWSKQNLGVNFERVHLIGGTLYALPREMPVTGVQVLRAGIRLGEFTDRFEPSHSLAMCLKKGEADGVELDEKTALNYLKGLTFGCGCQGWKLALYNGYPLGWCKAAGGVAKNKLPKGLRI